MWTPALSHRLGFAWGGSVLLDWTPQIKLGSVSCEVQLLCPAVALGFKAAQGWILAPYPTPNPPQCRNRATLAPLAGKAKHLPRR